MSTIVTKSKGAKTTSKPTSGRLFFLDLGADCVLSANPDGSDLKAIVTEGRRLPDGVVVDVAAGHIYWTNIATYAPLRVWNYGKAGFDRNAQPRSYTWDLPKFSRGSKHMLARQALDNWQLAEVNNWDVSLFKNFPLASELRALQFRWNCTMPGITRTSPRPDGDLPSAASAVGRYGLSE